MSGLEVLGLVLGAIPLLVSACEHFRDACAARNLLFRFEGNHAHVLRNVKDEELYFRLHLKKLLLPLIRDQSCDLSVLLLDPANPQWKDQKADELLRRRLADGHERYIEILDSVTTILHKLLTTLKYTHSPFQEKLEALKRADESNGLTAKLRLKLRANPQLRARHLDYVVSKWNRDFLVQELRENRERLEKILNDNSEIAVLQEQTTIVVPRQATRSLLQHWQHASRVYDLIFKTCSCRQSHCAHLWLQHHESPAFELKLLVFFSSTALSYQPRPWQPQGLCIEFIDQPPEQHVQTALSVDTTADENKETLAAVRSAAKASSDSKRPCKPAQNPMRFLTNPQAPRPALRSPAGEMPESSKPAKKARFAPDNTPKSSPSTAVIHDLCGALADCGMEPIRIGTLTAQEPSHDYHYKVSSRPEQKIIADDISLHDILRPTYRPRLSRADRMRTALKISSSHLKLHSTPWVRKQRESRNIKFPCTGEKRVVLTDRPFIDTDFIEENVSSTQPVDPSAKSFVCLGIILLELLFGTTLEEHELWQQFGENKDNALLRLTVASQWANTVKDEAGQDFAAIVKWCLNESPLTLQDEKWREDLADRVVLPLQKCCEWVEPIEVERL